MFHPAADLFFESPAIARPFPGDFGVLHLLRKDAIICLGIDPATGTRTNYRALWPGAMAILAGIDLVAKFWRGTDASGRGQVGARFTDFVHAYFQPVSAGDEDTMYQLRNSLLHSFGLYSKRGRQEYHFSLTAAGNVAFIQQPHPTWYQLDLLVLHQRFEQALTNYTADLEQQRELQTNFLAMFRQYGGVHIAAL